MACSAGIEGFILPFCNKTALRLTSSLFMKSYNQWNHYNNEHDSPKAKMMKALHGDKENIKFSIGVQNISFLMSEINNPAFPFVNSKSWTII